MDEALSRCGGAYMGTAPLAGTPKAPWLQVVTPGSDPASNAAGLIYEAGTDSAEIRRLSPGQLLGLYAGKKDIRSAVDTALELSADVLILDQTRKGLTGLWPELDTCFDLSVMRDAVARLRELGREEEVALVAFGGVRSGTDLAKTLAYNCMASAFGTAMALAMGAKIDDAGLVFENEDPGKMAEAAEQFIRATTQEAAIIARCAGKTNIHNLEPEDMRCMTLAAARDLDLPLTSGPVKREGF